MKTLDENFTDWMAENFGYGYGTGEQYIIPALKKFFELCEPHPDSIISNEPTFHYDYRILEKELTPTVAWLLINSLCKNDLIEYGSSSRFGWLTTSGKHLKIFFSSKIEEELYNLTCVDNHIYCTPTSCNCGENGYEEGRICDNPFWKS